MIGTAAAAGVGLFALRCATAAVLAFAAALLAMPAARAAEAVNVRLDAPAIDLTAATELQEKPQDHRQGPGGAPVRQS